MSFNLGNWANKLKCDLCTGTPPIDLGVPDDFYDNDGFPDDFWDDPPEPAEGFLDGLDVPDNYPSASFPDDGIIIKWNGTF